ncbi:MAG TPA: dockerin type I repeat-containing protein [Tepidisphaeraceae bacterium]|nr:dockerin type I repeat-containing protein [Tepidisphaeraceae bacterium]
MRSVSAYSKFLVFGISCLSAGFAYGTDLRFDVLTSNSSVLLPNLAFPNANGHYAEMGSANYLSILNNSGNTLGNYYNFFNSQMPFTNYPDPHDMAVHIQQWVNNQFTTDQNAFIALNEVSSSNWSANPVNQDGIDYRDWVADVVELLKNGDSSDPNNIVPAHSGVLLYVPIGAPSGNPSSPANQVLQTISQYAYIGVERYINGTKVQADGFSVSAVQSYYQTAFDHWVNNAGVSPSDLVLTEIYSVSAAGSSYGATGLSGTDWQEAIETRCLAAYNVGFAGYSGYDWGKNDQNADNATLTSYEKAYASMLVTPTEVPCWTGNNSDVTGNSWADYLNWTGGLPSTTSDPYPLLAANNTNLPKQIAANFLDNANPLPSGTIITLDGNQSITTMTFDSANSYTIAPGTGGTLTLTGASPSITVNSGSHFISAGVILNNDISANLVGNLSLSGGITTNGHTLTKSGTGTLNISGLQSHSIGSAINITGGTLNLNSDAGSSAAPVLTLSATGGSINLNTRQHLASLNLNGGNASVQTELDHVLTDALTISNGSTLDLSNNDMIVNYTGPSPFNQIDADLASGCNDGKWNGTGIASSAAAQKTVHDTALAVDEASHLFGLTGSNTTHYDGETIDSTTIIVKYTWVGDLNMDGVVNTTDRDLMSPAGTTNATWAMGDFNYDGIVNADDLALWQFAYVESGGQMIPEPSVAISSLIFMGLLFRRSRRP